MRVTWLALLCALFYTAESRAGLKIYYLRHAEGGHNVVKQWEGIPRSEWPAYVGNENMFSPKGEEQITALTRKLSSYQFDLIACSPLWRTRNTILPYLREQSLTAEIWPELAELEYKESRPLPPPSPGLFSAGNPIIVPADEARWFTLRDGVQRMIKMDKSSPAQIQSDAEAIMKKNVELLKDRFGGKDVTVLLVGHGTNGSLLYRALTRVEKPEWPGNTRLWMVEQMPDGTFKPRMFNDRPMPE